MEDLTEDLSRNAAEGRGVVEETSQDAADLRDVRLQIDYLFSTREIRRILFSNESLYERM